MVKHICHTWPWYNKVEGSNNLGRKQTKMVKQAKFTGNLTNLEYLPGEVVVGLKLYDTQVKPPEIGLL